MSDHEPRLFCDDNAVRHIGVGLLACTLPKAEWTHEAHLAACLWLVVERPDIDPEIELPDIIRRYNVSAGGVNDDHQGYHETLTQLYIAGVRQWVASRAEGGKSLSLCAQANALIASPIGHRHWPLGLYSRDRLFSVEARRSLARPDLGSWPKAGAGATD